MSIELSTSIELEQLKGTRTQLEEEHRNLVDEHNNLELRTKILEERIAIQELKRDNNSNRDSIGKLKITIEELEHKLDGLSEEPKPTTSTLTFDPKPENTQPEENLISQETAQIEAETHNEQRETTEENVQVSVIEDTAVPKQDEVEVYKQHEKKKRRLF